MVGLKGTSDNFEEFESAFDVIYAAEDRRGSNGEIRCDIVIGVKGQKLVAWPFRSSDNLIPIKLVVEDPEEWVNVLDKINNNADMSPPLVFDSITVGKSRLEGFCKTFNRFRDAFKRLYENKDRRGKRGPTKGEIRCDIFVGRKEYKAIVWPKRATANLIPVTFNFDSQKNWTPIDYRLKWEEEIAKIKALCEKAGMKAVVFAYINTD